VVDPNRRHLGFISYERGEGLSVVTIAGGSSCFGWPKSAMENSVGIGLKDCTLTDSAFKLKENELSHCTWSSLCLMTHCGHQNRNESSHCTRWPLCHMTHCGHHKLSLSHWTLTQCSKQDPDQASADSHLNCNSNNRENCYDFFISNQTVSTYKVIDNMKTNFVF